MSYKCQVCGAVSPSGIPRMLHIVKRPDGQIAREIPVCGNCAEGFRSGKFLAMMQRIQLQQSRETKEKRKESKEEKSKKISSSSLVVPQTECIIQKETSPKIRVVQFIKPKER